MCVRVPLSPSFDSSSWSPPTHTHMHMHTHAHAHTRTHAHTCSSTSLTGQDLWCSGWNWFFCKLHISLRDNIYWKRTSGPWRSDIFRLIFLPALHIWWCRGAVRRSFGKPPWRLTLSTHRLQKVSNRPRSLPACWKNLSTQGRQNWSVPLHVRTHSQM